MAGYYTESNYENAVLQLINEGLGYNYVYGPEVERDYHSPLYEDVLLPALQRINKGLPMEAVNEANDCIDNNDSLLHAYAYILPTDSEQHHKL